MCTYITEQQPVDGSGKGPNGCGSTSATPTVYFDHPVHAQADHTLNIDFTDPSRGRRPGWRSNSPPPRRANSSRRSPERWSRHRRS